MIKIKIKKYFFVLVAMFLVFPSLVIKDAIAEGNKDRFSDINIYLEEIYELVDRGVIQGYPDNTFRPNNPVTRGEYALFISRALDLPTSDNPKEFKDVAPRMKTYDGIIKAYNAGVVNGYPDGRFRPDNYIDREEMAIMLDNALQTKGDFKEKAKLNYSDKGKIGGNAYGAVERLTYYNVMGAIPGNSNNIFDPARKGTRLLTVLSIYELLQVTNMLENDEVDNPSNEPTAKELFEQNKAFKINGFEFTPEPTREGYWILPSGELYSSKNLIGMYSLDIPEFKNLQSIGINVSLYENRGIDPYVSMAMDLALFVGVDLQKDELVEIVKEVLINKKTKKYKGYKFELLPQDKNYPDMKDMKITQI